MGFLSALTADGTPILVEKISAEDALAATRGEPSKPGSELQYTTLSGATSLIELSKSGEGQTTFVMDGGSEEDGDGGGTTTTVVMEDEEGGTRYLLVTTDDGDGEQKLVPVSAEDLASVEEETESEEAAVP